MSTPAMLALSDGTIFHGVSFGAHTEMVGELVFNTAMSGYQEILTDPSYAKQLIILTYPHIGNVGTNRQDNESSKVFCSGLIVRDVPKQADSWRNESNLSAFLLEQGIPAICDIDTRKLTRIIREKGSQSACLIAGAAIDEQQALAKARLFPGMQGLDLAKEVSVRKKYQWSQGSWSLNPTHNKSDKTPLFKVAAYDYGVKHNILRLLVDQGCSVTVYPAQTPASEILEAGFDGVFLSNGPGDPQPCDYAIEAICELLNENIPIFGICLGHQLLAIASGAETEKMKFGHHGANHPVQDLLTSKVVITSQNHSFAVSEKNLPNCLRVTHRSLFDNTNQGLERIDKPAFSFQGHPEASPGPQDSQYLFERFVDLMGKHK